MNPSNVIRKTDPNGAAVVGVPLTQGAGVAWLDAEDHEAIIRDLGNVSWFVGRNSEGRTYVRLCNPNTGVQETVARIITGRLRQTCVAYVDEDRLNLRRRNLLVVRGGGGQAKRRRGVVERTRRGNTVPGGLSAPY